MNTVLRSSHHKRTINARRRTPAVRRTRELLRAGIVHQLLPGDMLPSEFDLMALYNVSRGVIREALDLLRDEGLIDRLQGAGTFVVAPERQVIQVDQLGAMVRNIEDGDARIRYDLLAFETLSAPDLVAERLHLPEGTEVTYVERLQSLDGEPVMIRSSWIPLGVGEIRWIDASASRRALDDLIERALGHPVERAELRIEATLADAATTTALSLEVGAPVVLLERLMYDVSGQAVEYGHARIRGDRFALTTHMRRTGVTSPTSNCPPPNTLAVTPTRSRRLRSVQG